MARTEAPFVTLTAVCDRDGSYDTIAKKIHPSTAIRWRTLQTGDETSDALRDDEWRRWRRTVRSKVPSANSNLLAVSFRTECNGGLCRFDSAIGFGSREREGCDACIDALGESRDARADSMMPSGDAQMQMRDEGGDEKHMRKGLVAMS